MDSTPIQLFEVSSGKDVDALLHDDITPTHLENQKRQWSAAFGRLVGVSPNQQDAHWQWDQKMIGRRNFAFESFCIELGDSVEGLMILSFNATSRLNGAMGKDIVYLEYIAVAPWNRLSGDQQPRYRRVGTYLFQAAVKVSLANELKGRIGLHSLPQAESFYRDKLGMIDLGPDPSCQNLRYFELPEAQVSKVIS
ncbi:MAG: GNAT family N-acetyltransferase [Verrucomicrobiota bacterium JB024]|nr:GNAT family N-acetyltransferase [Verrucomicrobiota bacterium JB024]